MRLNKGMFKVLSWVIGITVLLAFLPSNVSAHPVDFSGVSKLGGKVEQIAKNAKKSLTDIKIHFGAGNAPPHVTTDAVQKIIAEADPDKDNQIRSPSGKITLAIPKGAISKASQIEFDEYEPIVSSGMVMLNRFSLTAKDKASGNAFSKFNKNLQISIQHNPGDLAGVDPNSIKLYYQDEKTKQWVPVASSKYDPKTNTLTGPTNHFTNFSEQGNPLIVGPGSVLAAQVGLQSGASMFSYPIDLPPGPGGFQPKLALSYNSASVDEMKDKQDVGSWVGIGWNLDFGSISYAMNTNIYYLELNGAYYKIVSTDGVNYYTNPDQHFKITCSGNTWSMYDKDGNFYQFGGTSDSQQYIGGTSGTYYCWDLSLIRDTNQNQATVSYHQDIMGTAPNNWVRSAYPATMTYGNVQISFTSAYDVNDPTDGYLRNDDPKTCNQNPPPKVFENRKLTTIEVRVSNNLIRKYNFTYATTNSTLSTDYGGIYYAGILSLTSLTQVGTDGTSQMPPMTFTYQSLQTGYQDSIGPSYTGNPGNPASFNWPHLTVVNNGYGGSTTFAYTQIPNSTTTNIWTREAVTQKTVADGIGPNETTQYAYAGNPYYNGTGWTEQFRGWNEVTETDAASNYINHWFYTTGTINGNDAEKLTGKEYQTQRYNSSGTLLDTKTYNWNWTQTGQYTVPPIYTTGWSGYLFYGTYYNLPTLQSVAASSDGYVYACSSNSIFNFTSSGTLVTCWSSYFDGDSYESLGFLQSVAVSSNGYIYACSSRGIIKFTSGGGYVTEWGGYVTNGVWYNLPTLQSVAASSNGYVYACSSSCMFKFTSDGTCVAVWYNFPTIQSMAASSDGCVYACSSNSIFKFTSDGTLVIVWSGYLSNGTYYNLPILQSVAASSDGYVYACSSSSIFKFTSSGTLVTVWYNLPTLQSVTASSNGYVYACSSNSILTFLVAAIPVYPIYNVYLSQVQETIGTKTSQTRYSYDGYGNVITTYNDGDTSTNADDSTIWRVYNTNTTANILDKVERVRVYATAMTTDSGGTNLKQETDYYYDGNNTSLTTPPTKGMVTRVQQMKDASNSVSSYVTYDTYGNKLTAQDPNGNTTTWTYDSTYHAYPATKTDPITGLTESYTYDPGTNNLLTSTDVNGQVISYYYDTFKRLTSVAKPGDTQGSPSITYQYNNWGTLNSQNVKTIAKIDASNSIWKADYFDGLGRVVQTQAQSETSGHTIISSTTAYNNCGQVSQQYVSQDIGSILSAYYNTGISSWKVTSYTYDGLGRVLTQTNPDGTTTSNDYTQPWQTNVTNALNFVTKYYYDAFNRLVEVQEPNSDNSVYATTHYSYDVLGNLIQVVDNNSNTTTMTYDWLSRKTGMTDPDMGTWSYGYDSSGNLTSQTDAKSQTITMVYDAMNRLTNKNYPSGSGMTNIVYSYDSTANGNYGKGQRTGMTDAAGTTSDKYDTRGRLVEEKKTINSVNYTTDYTYDGLDRAVTVTYPTGETVTNTYNGRGLPSTVSGSTVGSLVTSTVYNQLGSITQINLNNGLKTNYSYWGIDHATTAYGKLWEIKTQPQGGGTAIQDMQYTWDANGNLTHRQNLVSSETENFTYDSLDRLTAVSGAYTQSYAYNTIGNITSMNGTSYTYGSKPQAVTSVGSTNYAYDANGNMTNRGAQTIGWDVENRPVAITGGASFVYDGDGNRVEQTAGGQTTLYINQYYEINITTGVATTYYYLGGQLVAQRTGSTLKYIHQDSLSSTSVMSTSTGTLDSSIAYFPFGSARTGSVNTTEEFTGQRHSFLIEK